VLAHHIVAVLLLLIFSVKLPCRWLICFAAAVVAAATLALAEPQVPNAIDIRGRHQSLAIYGSPRGEPVIVSSGDGGWMHLGPHVAELLGSRGYFVIGFDAKSYLESFTGRQAALRAEDVPSDYAVLAELARRLTGKKPILIGVSEGAGLSVLAATDPHTRDEIAGVVGLGLPETNELAWRWKDAVIYLTHRAPNEPAFNTTSVVGRVAPAPLALIHSPHDEFAPLADARAILSRAGDPKRLWVVPSANHRFSDNLPGFDATLLEALAWVKAHG
jgi:fermentation-respiration switch protein FrsA (DUF1100 family)